MRRRRGIALVVVLLALLLLGVIAGGMAAVGSHTLQLSRSNLEGDQALLAADAGAWRTAGELVRNDAFPGYSPLALPTTGATYEVSVTKGPGTAPNGAAVPSGMCYVLSTGQFGQTVRQVGLLLQLSTSSFPTAAFAAEEIDLVDESEVDTWDSSQGRYPAGGQPGKGNIGTNSMLPRSIRIEDESKVDGTAYVPAGAPPNAVRVIDESTLVGGVGTLPQLRPLPPVVLPADPSTAPSIRVDRDVTLAPGVYGDVSLEDGAVLALTSGTYVFRSISLDDASTIGLPRDLTTPAEVYVQNRLEIIDGSILNSSALPAKLKFYVQQGPVVLDDDSGSAFFV
ncbi:MAG: hypothetical protein AB1758_25375, partial [Candidatus Eremiobacterota bacterium]